MKAPSNEIFVKVLLAATLVFACFLWVRSGQLVLAEGPTLLLPANPEKKVNAEQQKTLPFYSDLNQLQCAQSEQIDNCSQNCASSSNETVLKEEIKKQEEKEKKEAIARAKKNNSSVKKKSAAAKSGSVPARVGRIGVSGKIYANTRTVNGRKVCASKSDNPQTSGKNSRGHIDGECCLDPDETPNANCYYPPEKYGKLLERYLKR